MRQRFPELLKALCAMALEEPLQKLTDKMLENLHNPAAVVRYNRRQDLVRFFEEAFAANRKENPFTQTVGAPAYAGGIRRARPKSMGKSFPDCNLPLWELLVNWRFEGEAPCCWRHSGARRGRDEKTRFAAKKEAAGHQSAARFFSPADWT